MGDGLVKSPLSQAAIPSPSSTTKMQAYTGRAREWRFRVDTGLSILRRHATLEGDMPEGVARNQARAGFVYETARARRTGACRIADRHPIRTARHSPRAAVRGQRLRHDRTRAGRALLGIRDRERLPAPAGRPARALVALRTRVGHGHDPTAGIRPRRRRGAPRDRAALLRSRRLARR